MCNQRFFLTSILTAWSMLACAAWAEEPVHFADGELENAVEQAIGINDPTPSDMLLLTSLAAQARHITSLTGLEYALNLESLYLSENQIGDLSPLSALTELRNVFLSGNQISAIPVFQAAFLSSLFLDRNQISDISSLSGLMHLDSLNLGYNRIADLSALSGMNTLTHLYLPGNQVSDISVLSALTNLEYLHLSENYRISDISVVSGLNKLKNLHLTGNQITTLPPLPPLELYDLYLDGNQISSIAALSGLKSVVNLSLSYNRIVDIAPLVLFTGLHYVNLQGNPLDCSAYRTIIPLLEELNPGVDIRHDTMPPECGNQPPGANAGADQTVEQANGAGTEVVLDGSGSTDPDSTPGTNDDIVSFEWSEGEAALGSGPLLSHVFPPGIHTVVLTATDSRGESATDEVIIAVQDTTPPSIVSVGANPRVLWPPNHQMVKVTVAVNASDTCDPVPLCWIADITSNEPANGLGDGDTSPDWRPTDDPLAVFLRAERAGSGRGRIYGICLHGMDAAGNVATAVVYVTVPRDQGRTR